MLLVTLILLRCPSSSETCIKGHRSSTCRHTDRALYEIKKKGRPVTQCEHCRELRKTRQVHVKCICEGREDNRASDPPGIKKGVSHHLSPMSSSVSLSIRTALHIGHTKIPSSATFPNGLPEALGTVALQTSSEETSDSDHGGMQRLLGGLSCFPSDTD